jgi:septal ring factor EnvC (AmiA/AmiB activator)
MLKYCEKCHSQLDEDGQHYYLTNCVKEKSQDLENRLAKNHEDYKIQVNAIADKNDKIAELEKQLTEQKIISDENYNAYMTSMGANKSLRKKLAESVPKSEIKKLIETANDLAGYSSVKFLERDSKIIFADEFVGAIEKLLQEKVNND